MKILMISIGSRGDCEPFLGVAEMLRSYGEEVVCAFPQQYRKLAEESDFDFYSLGSEFLDLLDTDTGREAMGGGKSGLKKIKALIDLSKQSLPIQRRMIDLQYEIIMKIAPDCIIFHPKVTVPLPWHLKTGGKIAMLSPVPCMLHDVKGYSNVGINKNLGSLINPLTYKLANSGTASAIMMAVKKHFPNEYTKKLILKELLRMKVFYTVSPVLFKQPDTWPDNAMVAGFWERDQMTGWQPSQDLLAFLDHHEKVILITFGSMVNPEPERTTALILEVLKELGIAAIINIAGGGLRKIDRRKINNIFWVDGIPYDWAFPQMYGVIHHGGAGTTHSALKAGCATMAIPHTADQPLWDQLIASSGAGPKGIPIGKLKRDILRAKLLDLVSNEAYKSSAEQLAIAMSQEDYGEELYQFIVN
ncbi:glycosyltransferase [Eubacteriaceae bacterium ES2]|nr:glycosyltransferase [Eubacteriaceae bacterium ES2]